MHEEPFHVVQVQAVAFELLKVISYFHLAPQHLFLQQIRLVEEEDYGDVHEVHRVDYHVEYVQRLLRFKLTFLTNQ